VACQETADDTLLAPAVDDHHTRRASGIEHWRWHTHLSHEIGRIGVLPGNIVCPDQELAEHAAVVAQAFGQRSGINASQGRDAFLV
jgi:hypothetical protein